MLTDGIKLTEGSDIVNAVVDSGSSFPSLPNIGELFFRTDTPALHVYDGSSWVQVGLTTAQLNGQPGSYYLALANATGTLQVSQGGTGSTSAAQARINLGVQIGTDVQAQNADLLAIASLAGTTGYLKKTGVGLWALDTTSYLPTSGGTIVGQLNMTGDIIPTSNITYRLGTPTMMWKDLYVGPGSIYLNGKKILQDVSDTIVFSTDVNQNLRISTSGTGNLELQPASTGAILLKGPVSVTSGNRIIDSAGIKVEFGSSIELNSNKITGLGAPTNANDAATKSYADAIASAATNASALTSGTIADARIAASSIVQHQAALTIAESQITDGSLLARNASNETITGTWSFNNAITVGTPSANSHAATKAYVDSIASGVNPQLAVKAATTGNITLGGLQSIDGVSLVDGDRILVKDQSAAALNGVYVVSAGAWARATDFDGAPTNEVVTGDLVFVSEGSTNANTSFVLVTEGTITVGTTGMTFSVFSRAGDLNAGNGLTRTGQTIDVVGTTGRIIVGSDSIDLAFAGTAGTYTSVTTDAFGRVTAGTAANLSFTGDATGSGPASGAISLALASVGTAGTYKSVTVDTKGRVTAGTNPTTLAGYGITDAQPLNTNLSALGAISTTGIEVRSGVGTYTTRSIAVSGTGLSITNADGVGGNPTVTISSTGSNTPSTLVQRDGSGNFAAGTITAALSGNATSATLANSSRALAQSDGTSWLTPSTSIGSTGARGTDLAPNAYSQGLFSEFKNAGLYGTSGNYAGLITYANWMGTAASTGDPSYQLLFSPAGVNSTAAPTLKIRAGIDTTWGAFSTILHSSNYNSYSPTLTGTGASGTWSINVSGSAGSIGGYGVSVSNANSSIVVRDSSSYVYLNYINSNTANNENSTISQIITTTGADNFYRKNSLANFASQVGPNITSLGTIATLNGVSPSNGVIRLTPNLHLNSAAGNAVILNWDNGSGGSTGNQAVRIGSGAAADVWSATYGGATTQTGAMQAPSVISTGSVAASGAGGFLSTTYALNSRNPIWRFGNADGYGLSYFQGSAGYGGVTDSLGFHFGTSTAAASSLNISQTAVTSQVPVNMAGNNRTVYGPNSTWGAYLYLGGDGPNGITRTSTLSTIATTNGNLHIDPGTDKATYLNFYAGTGGIQFGNGASAVIGTMTAAGLLTMPSFSGNGAGLTSVNAATVGGLGAGSFFQYQGFSLDANTMAVNRSGFTYSVNAPYTGPIVHFDASNYGMQFNGAYNNGNSMSFRTKNGDGNVWNPWRTIIHDGNYTSYSPTLTGGGASGTWGIGISGNAGSTSMSAGRTDSASYPVVWGVTGGTSQLYSCSAVNIQSSTGTLNASAIYATGDITAFSDARVKSNVVVIDSALEKMKQIRGVTFTRTDEPHAGQRQAGVIAQEVEVVLPEVVKTNDDGMKSVNYGALTSLLIEAIKELNLKVEVLEAKLAKYEV